MNRDLAIVAAAMSALALYLPTRSQEFTRVTVDGRVTRMLVAGSGDVAVVFENGYGAPLETWGKVQPEVSRFARTVAYDRAGVGLSDDGPAPRDGRRFATELRAALRAANVAPPYVLVGHSLGGIHARAFAATFPGEVAGLVLVDPTHEGEALGMVSPRPELNALPTTIAHLRAVGVPVGIPVTLISAMEPAIIPFQTARMRAASDARRTAQVADSTANHKWLNTVPGGRFIVTRRNGHNVPQEDPALVVTTIREATARR